MRKIALCCLLLAGLSTAAVAEQATFRTFSLERTTPSAESTTPVVIPVGWVGVGTPDCHTQGVLFRVAHNCPPAAIAEAAAAPPVTYVRPVTYQHASHSHHFGRSHRPGHRRS
jgi:hypothetical protein